MNISRILEAILFSAEAPLTAEQIAFALPDVPQEEIAAALEDLQQRYEAEQRGWRLEQIAGGWQLLSHPDLYSFVERFLEGKRRSRLSRAALEALAVVAYRQPITRGELEDLRGVDCAGVLHTLIERDLVTVSGRSNAIGRPLLYKTTDRFLEHFGLFSLSDLPHLAEVEALWGSEDVRTQLEAELARRLGPAGDPSGSPAGDRPGEASAEAFPLSEVEGGALIDHAIGD